MKRLSLLLCGIFVALSMGTSVAASPPTIARVWSWNISATTAGLSMSYRNNDQNSRVWFEYSTQSSLAGATRAGEEVRPPNSGGSQSHVDLTGLKPNTTYYYRAFIRNYDGELYSATESFRTAAGSETRPPAVEFKEARQTGSSIELGFVCDGKGSSATCAAYWSTSSGMAGKQELKRESLSAAPGGSWMYATFKNSNVPDNTRIYIQAEITSANGTAKTDIREFVIRNKPI